MAKKFLSYEGLQKLKQELDVTYAPIEHTHDDLKQEIQNIKASVSSVYKPQGSITGEQISNITLDVGKVGYVYNITTDFVTTDAFIEGAGIEYGPGTNIVCIMNGAGDFYWDVLGGGGAIEEITDAEIEEIFGTYSANVENLSGYDNDGNEVNINYEEVE